MDIPATAHTEDRVEEQRLVRRAQLGDGRAFEQLADRHTTRLRRVLYRITRDCEAAMDAVQEALVRAWRNIGRFENRARFFTWLTRIGINEAYRGMERTGELPIDPHSAIDEQVPDATADPARIGESREALSSIALALRQLPPERRAAIELRDIDGLSTKQAAARVGVSERAFKSRLHRGRLELRALVDANSRA